MIKRAEIKDLHTLADLAVLLWPAHSVEELEAEFAEIFTAGKAQFFLKYADDIPAGFAQCQLRFDYAEGTQTSPVGYLEGVYVKERFRHQGFAGELLTACERWAKEQGCREFASDCALENEDSIRFHQAMHFTEANRIVCFTKKI